MDIKSFEHYNKEAAYEHVINEIKGLLFTNKLKPGDKLPSEMELAESLGVGRSSVREAMKILSSFGVITIKRGQGTFVAESGNEGIFNSLLFQIISNQQDIEELLELRTIIERAALELAIKNVTEDDLKLLEDSLNELLEITKDSVYDEEAIIENELKFHGLIVEITKNKLLQGLYNYILGLYVPILYKNKIDADFIETASNNHKMIINALKMKNDEVMVQAMTSSVDAWNQILDEYNK